MRPALRRASLSLTDQRLLGFFHHQLLSTPQRTQDRKRWYYKKKDSETSDPDEIHRRWTARLDDLAEVLTWKAHPERLRHSTCRWPLLLRLLNNETMPCNIFRTACLFRTANSTIKHTKYPETIWYGKRLRRSSMMSMERSSDCTKIAKDELDQLCC